MMEPLVTIAIPTCNRADTYLPLTLQSALAQTYKNLEIFVSDNCSTDNTSELVKSFDDTRLGYIRQEKRLSYIEHANFCVERAQGNYVVLLHDDDLIDEDFIDCCLGTVNHSFMDIGVIRTGTRWIDKDGKLLNDFPNEGDGLSHEEFFRAYFKMKTGMYLCSTLFNRKRLLELGGFHSRYNLLEDVMATINLAVKFGRRDLRASKASNRKHSSELTFSSSIHDWCEESLDLIQLMCSLSKGDTTRLEAEGNRTQAYYCYHLASKIASPVKRVAGYWIVYNKFHKQYFPPLLRNFIGRTPFYGAARYLKNLLKTP